MLFLYLSLLDDNRKRIILEEFYLENIDFLLNYSKKFLKDKYKAEEAVHEAFIYIIKNKDKYIKEDKLEMKKLAITIVRGKTIDLIRREKKYINMPEEDVEIIVDLENLTESIVEEKDALSILRKHLKDLDQLSRQILIMKYIDKMSVKEIGDILNLKVKTVETRLYRGKQKLKANMEKEGFIYG